MWKLEKNQMQSTILTLSQEVEYLSVRNQKMLTDLKRKDPFYDTYVKTSEELTKLRQAHAILISMIKSNHVNIKQNSNGATMSENDPYGAIDKYELQVSSARPANLIQNPYRGGSGF